MKKHNFSAGPSILSKQTIEQTSNAVKDLNNSGLSVMEISHRSKEFTAIINEAKALFRELLNIPDGYSILFLGGGASLQFCMIPYNLMQKKAAYLITGSWAKKAQKEAKFFGEVVNVASSEDKNFSYIPNSFDVPDDADYFHFTSNNTIYGTQIRKDFDLKMPVVCDMSSDILSRQIDVSKYGIIYGGLQKNIGPSGCSFVIIRDDILGKVDRSIPTYLNYNTHIEKESLFNTPPVVPIYATLETFKWLKDLGGVGAIEKLNEQKAGMLYDEIDRNKLFVPTVEAAEDRSYMNVCFVMSDAYKELEKEFLEFAISKGMVGIKGHRSVGGFRASIYNAMPTESIRALIETMKEFEKNKA
jgi:phosphoserine aminotransferase